MKNKKHEVDKLIDRHELARRVPYSQSHIYRLERAGEFPRRIQIGANRVAWSEAEINAWIANKKQAKGAA